MPRRERRRAVVPITGARLLKDRVIPDVVPGESAAISCGTEYYESLTEEFTCLLSALLGPCQATLKLEQ